LVDRILAPARKRKADLLKAGNIITVEANYREYEILREMTNTTGQDMILNIKLKGHTAAPGKPFLGNVVLVIK